MYVSVKTPKDRLIIVCEIEVSKFDHWSNTEFGFKKMLKDAFKDAEAKIMKALEIKKEPVLS